MAAPFWMTAFLDFAPPDFDRGVAYWSAVTGYDVSLPRGEHDEFATLLPPEGDDYLCVQRLGVGPSRIHLDLHVDDPVAGAGAAASLGAHVVARPDPGYVVLRSPGGFTFCLVRHPAAVIPPPSAWPGVSRSRVYQVCLDISSSEYERERDFWAAMLEGTAEVLRRPEFERVRGGRRLALDLLLQRLDEESGPVRAHLDVGTPDRPAEVERHRALGGEVVAEEAFWTVLRDPSGSPYCVTDRDPATGRLVSLSRDGLGPAASVAAVTDTSAIERTDPPLRADETTTLLTYLDYHRDTLRLKTEGLDAAQLNTTLPPSTMTLGGMLKHLALVESNWFNDVLMGRPEVEPWAAVDWDADRDWEWHTAADDSPDELRRLFDEAIAASDSAIQEALAEGGLDRLSVVESRREGEGAFSLRWILVHMIEEYARHNGHADLIRESIDGRTGE